MEVEVRQRTAGAVTLEPPLNRDPKAFVQAAEDITNIADADAAAAIYAPDAVLELIADGASERHVGIDAITRAQHGYMAGLAANGFKLKKRLTTADHHTIVNEWQGTLRGQDAQGIEVWEFNPEGLVAHHRLYNFLNVRPFASVGARLGLLLSYPRAAIAMLRAQRAHA